MMGRMRLARPLAGNRRSPIILIADALRADKQDAYPTFAP
jgi:hypothetical protein